MGGGSVGAVIRARQGHQGGRRGLTLYPREKLHQSRRPLLQKTSCASLPPNIYYLPLMLSRIPPTPQPPTPTSGEKGGAVLPLKDS